MNIDVISITLGNIGELLSSELANEKSKNHAYLMKVLEYISG